MADPTFNQVTDEYGLYFVQKDALEVYTAGASGYANREDTLYAALLGAYVNGADGPKTAIASQRAAIAGLLTPQSVRAGVDGFLRQIGAAINSANAKTGQLDAIWADLYDYMHTNSLTVKSRGMTLNAPGAVSGTGNGVVVRCTVDERGYTMDGWWPDTFLATCTDDGRVLGQLHKERWKIEGRAIAADPLLRTGAGPIINNLASLTPEDSKALVQNPSWNDYTSAAVVGSPAVPTALPGWTPTGSLNNFKINLDDTLRTTPGDAKSASLSFESADTITQDLTAIKSAKFNADVPYVVGLAVKRVSACDRNCVITLGGVSRTYALTGQTDGNWARVFLVATPGQNSWLRAFNQTSMTLSIQMTGGTTGNFRVDDLVIAPMTRIQATPYAMPADSRFGRGAMGHYVAIIGGAPTGAGAASSTPFKKGDTSTWTDSEAGGVGGARTSKNGHWFAWSGRGYLPNTTGAATWADKS